MKLYNLTHRGKQYVSELPPSILPKTEYSFVEITYSYEMIESIKTVYFNNLVSEINLQNLDLSVFGNFIDKIDQFISSLSDEDKEKILNSIIFIKLPDQNEEPDNIKIRKLFILGISSSLSYFYFMKSELSEQIFGIDFNFPFDIHLNLIDNNVYTYIQYISNLVLSIDTGKIGRDWLVQIQRFFGQFGNLLPSEYKIDSHLYSDVAYSSIKGYSNFVYGEISKAINLFNMAERAADSSIGKINNEVDQIYDEVKIFKKRLFKDLEEKREDIHNEIKDLLYKEMPNITDNVEKSLDIKLYKILTKKIEDCFSHVLLDYKETAAYRLRDVLEPVVFESIQKFKDISDLSHNYIEHSVKECREFGKTSSSIIKTVDNIQSNLYSFHNNIIDENKMLKDEIKYLQDEVYTLNKLIERICRNNNLKL